MLGDLRPCEVALPEPLGSGDADAQAPVVLRVVPAQRRCTHRAVGGSTTRGLRVLGHPGAGVVAGDSAGQRGMFVRFDHVLQRGPQFVVRDRAGGLVPVARFLRIAGKLRIGGGAAGVNRGWLRRRGGSALIGRSLVGKRDAGVLGDACALRLDSRGRCRRELRRRLDNAVDSGFATGHGRPARSRLGTSQHHVQGLRGYYTQRLICLRSGPGEHVLTDAIALVGPELMLRPAVHKQFVDGLGKANCEFRLTA